MATLIPVFISALLVARANTKKENTASEERLQKLYKKAGFQYLDAPMGNTGHYSCPVWMLKKFI